MIAFYRIRTLKTLYLNEMNGKLDLDFYVCKRHVHFRSTEIGLAVFVNRISLSNNSI